MCIGTLATNQWLAVISRYSQLWPNINETNHSNIILIYHIKKKNTSKWLSSVHLSLFCFTRIVSFVQPSRAGLCFCLMSPLQLDVFMIRWYRGGKKECTLSHALKTYGLFLLIKVFHVGPALSCVTIPSTNLLTNVLFWSHCYFIISVWCQTHTQTHQKKKKIFNF